MNARSFTPIGDSVARSCEPFTTRNLRSIRPGYGLAPKHLPEVLGRKARSDVKRGTALAEDLIL